MKIKYQILNKALIRVSLLLIFIFLIFNCPSAFAWKLPLEISTVAEDGKKVSNKLVVGIEAGATDGFDYIWDTQALVSNPNPDNPAVLRAYIKNDSAGREDLKQLWKDIRGTGNGGSSTTWDITVNSVSAGKSVDISWDIPPGALKDGERLVLKDNSKPGNDNKPVQIDITQSPGYSYVSGDGETRSLSLTLSRPKGNNNSHKGSSGLGCGTIKQNNNNDSADSRGSAAAILILFIPLAVLRFIRLTRIRLFI